VLLEELRAARLRTDLRTRADEDGVVELPATG
jgi:hypothetical protein